MCAQPALPYLLQCRLCVVDLQMVLIDANVLCPGTVCLEWCSPTFTFPFHCAAGRHDLATAVKLWGGFRTVAKTLDRKLMYQWKATETDLGRIKTAVHSCQRASGLAPTAMPSRTQLERAGMSHVVRWIVAVGGFHQVRVLQCSMMSSMAGQLYCEVRAC
jgi:hypothetical protein